MNLTVKKNFKFERKLILTEVSGFENVQFETLDNIEVLEINKKQIKDDWTQITNGLVLVKSEAFKKLLISTESLEFSHVQ